MAFSIFLSACSLRENVQVEEIYMKIHFRFRVDGFFRNFLRVMRRKEKSDCKTLCPDKAINNGFNECKKILGGY